MPDRRQLGGVVAALLLSAGCGGAGAPASAYPEDEGSGPAASLFAEDRVVIGDFSRIAAVAAGQERIWMVGTDAIIGWDPQFGRWDGPYQFGRGLERVQWAAVDPLDQSLWLAHAGGWLHWQPDLRVWDGGSVGATVRGIAFDGADPGGGLYLRTSGGWLLVQRGSGTAAPSPGPAQPVEPPTVREALAANPSFAATSGAMLDARMRQVRITSAAQSWDRRGWYFATWGNGVVYVESGFPSAEPLRYGLAGEAVGALLAERGGVWVATDRSPEHEAALTLVARELDRFEFINGNPATGLPFTAARAMIGHGDALWLGTDAGVARVEEDDGRVSMVDESRGLADGRVLALASRRSAIEAGTRTGLARVHPDSLRAEALAVGETGTVAALAVLRDTTWVGTEFGVRILSADGNELVMPPGLASASFSQPILDLAWAGDTLVALTRDGIFWRDAAGSWTIGPDPTGLLGELGFMAVDDRGVWIVGDAAIGFATLGLPATPVIRPDLIPGRVTAVAVDDDYLWVGTTEGLVRFRTGSLRP